MAKVLVIDDSTLSRSMAAKALTDAGHTVVEAVDGEQGIAAYAEHQPDCVVTDLLMPVMDGHAFLDHIRHENIQVPVVVLTADIQSSTRAMCEEFGISGFVNKPVKAEVIRARVEEALSQAQRTS